MHLYRFAVNKVVQTNPDSYPTTKQYAIVSI